MIKFHYVLQDVKSKKENEPMMGTNRRKIMIKVTTYCGNTSDINYE